ncbi:MAG: transglycosylase SLT domain-containing protein [Flavobacteriales bacterium]
MGKAEWLGTAAFAALLGLLAFSHPPAGAGTEVERPSWSYPHVKRDLKQIRHDTLRVLVLRDPLSWEERPNAVTGVEWELLERFARQEHLCVKAVPVDRPDSMLAMLQRGEGDVIAAQLSPKGWAAPYVAFTHPYRQVTPVRMGLRPDPLLPKDRLAEDTSHVLHVSYWSPFLDAHGAPVLADSTLNIVVDSLLPDEVVIRTAIGRYASAVISDASAMLERRRIPQADLGPRLGPSVPLAFGVRQNAVHLLRALDVWLNAPAEQEARALLLQPSDLELARGTLRSRYGSALRGDSTVSPFDSLFQVHASDMAWDWKLLAAVAFKESRFDTSASYKGAEGMMQMLPSTAAQLGVDTADGLHGHIRGAALYLAELDTLWRSSVRDSDQRMKFVLASYNAGPGHVKDAQRLAERLGLDPHRWDGQVERALVLLNRPAIFLCGDVKNGYCHGELTFWYVRDIMAAFRGAGTKK